MKGFYLISSALAAVAIFSLASCEKAEFAPEAFPDGGFEVTFTDSERPSSRTMFHDTDSTQSIWWSKGDTIGFFQKTISEENAAAGLTIASCLISADRASFSHKVSSFKTPLEGQMAEYFSIFPRSRYKASSTFTTSGRVAPLIASQSRQRPSADSFDPHADLLISQYIVVDSLQSEFCLRYKRMVAIGNLKIINLPSAGAVRSVVFSAKKGGEDVILAGSAYYDLYLGKQSTRKDLRPSITIEYPELELSASGPEGMNAYFTCYPFSLESGDSFTVTVRTAIGETFEREVVIPEGRDLNFILGRRTNFTVDMSSVSFLKVREYSSATYQNTTQKLYYTVSSAKSGIDSMKVFRLKADQFALLDDLKAYADTSSIVSSYAQSSVDKINAGSSPIFSMSDPKMIPDADYVICVEAFSSDGSVDFASVVTRSDWFSMRTVNLTTAGKFQVYYLGRNVKSVSYHVVLTSDYEAAGSPGPEAWFEANGNGTAHGVTSNTNTKGETGTEAGAYAITPASGAGAYTFMVKATKTDGSVKYAVSNPTVK